MKYVSVLITPAPRVNNPPFHCSGFLTGQASSDAVPHLQALLSQLLSWTAQNSAPRVGDSQRNWALLSLMDQKVRESLAKFLHIYFSKTWESSATVTSCRGKWIHWPGKQLISFIKHVENNYIKWWKHIWKLFLLKVKFKGFLLRGFFFLLMIIV